MREDILRIISLGGINVTQNMFVYHFLPGGREENDEILIVDCGVGFPEGDLFGVDLIIPDFSYLIKREKKIKGLVLTHGHEDHIGALPLFLRETSAPFPIFAPRLGALLAEDKLREAGLKQRVKIIEDQSPFRLGKFLLDPIRVTHSIPDTYHFLINTPLGNFYHGSDFKFDLTPLDGKFPDLSKIAHVSEKGVMVLLSDCLGSERPGYSPSEKELGEKFEKHISRARGRVLVTCLSSNIYRWQQAINASKKVGRKIVLVGMSVEKNVKLAKKIGYLNLHDADLVQINKAKNYPDRQLTFLVAGSLGQAGSSLDRIVVGKHKITIKPTDKVIFSSPDYIPGTSSAVHHMINNLARMGIEVVYPEGGDALHVSGHGFQQELALLINLTSPDWLFPIGGEYRHIRQYAALVEKMGLDLSRVIVQQKDQALLFNRHGLMKQGMMVPTRQVLVDGLGVGDVGQIVLRDRGKLAREGMIVIIYLVDSSTRKLAGGPYVVSRGFVYVKENKRLLAVLKQFAKKLFSENVSPVADLHNARQIIQGEIEKKILDETGRQPMVLPVVIDV